MTRRKFSQVIEAYFLNDRNEYFQIEISPRGRYKILLLNGVRNYTLKNLPLFPDGVSYINNCIDNNQVSLPHCHETWHATAIVPKEYLPRSVTKFNAHAIHGKNFGEVKPTEENRAYKSLYPTDVEATGQEEPDFHEPADMKPIDLEEIGFHVSPVHSEIWEAAVGEGEYSMRLLVPLKN